MGEISKRHLVDLMLSCQIVVEYMAGPQVTDDNFDRVVKEGEILVGQAEARTGAFYSNHGIEATKMAEEDSGDIFLPWGSILAIYGQQRNELISSIREAAEQAQAEDSSGSSPT